MKNVIILLFCLMLSFSMFAQPLDFSVDNASNVSKVTFNVSGSFSTIKVEKSSAKLVISYAENYSIAVIPEDNVVPNKDFTIDATGDKITVAGIKKSGFLGMNGHDLNIGTIYITTPNLHKLDSSVSEKRNITQSSNDKFNVATSGRSIFSTSNASWFSLNIATSGESVIDLSNVTVLSKSDIATSGDSRFKFTNATLLNDFNAETSGDSLFDIIDTTFFEDVEMSLSGGSVITLTNVYANEVTLHSSGKSTVVIH